MNSYLSTNRVDGETLLDHVSQLHSLTENDIANFVRQLCEVLAFMHSHNCVHNDIRVSNCIKLNN